MPRCSPTQLLRHISLFKTRKGLQAKHTKGQSTHFSVLSYIKSYYLCVQGYELFRVQWSCPVDCHSDLRHRSHVCHGNCIFVAPAVGLDSIDSLAAVSYFAVCLGILSLLPAEALPLNIDPANIFGATEHFHSRGIQHTDLFLTAQVSTIGFLVLILAYFLGMQCFAMHL